MLTLSNFQIQEFYIDIKNYLHRGNAYKQDIGSATKILAIKKYRKARALNKSAKLPQKGLKEPALWRFIAFDGHL
jgi:hypothetical protein